VAAIGLMSFLALSCSRQPAPIRQGNWNRTAAATYLDSRENWWMQWNGASRDHGTFCVSCHTTLPYVMSRAVLSDQPSERGPAADEREIIDNVKKRVRLWNDIGPYYSDHGYDKKTAQSRGTESVLNALILSNYDSQRRALSEETEAAFVNMWALQQSTGELKGAWLWLQFDQEPWEASDSAYYGAALAAIAVGIAPDDYARTPQIQNNLTLLREYLTSKSTAQSTINRMFLLLASTKLSLLNPEAQKAIIDEILNRQQADGGWRLASITWRWHGWSLASMLKMWFREDGTPLEGKSDGLATGLATFVLEEAGVPGNNVQLQRGLSWLATNQNAADGSWPASSVNKRRSMTSETGRFMSDAATAYAVLALSDAKHKGANAKSIAER